MDSLQKQIDNMKNDNTGVYDYNSKLLELNMTKSLQEPGVYYNTGVSEIVDFPDKFGFIFLGALVLLGVSPVFSEEYAVNVDALIFSSKNGRRKAVNAKIAASLIFVISAVLFFSMVNVFTNMYFYGGYGWDAPLQSIFDYVISPYSLNIAQYCLLRWE
jgi:ABC-type transport system involved in multi-copper enzyme maturation permease subunit